MLFDHDSVQLWLDTTEHYRSPLLSPHVITTPSIDFYRYYDPNHDEDIKPTVISQHDAFDWSYVEKYKTYGQLEKTTDDANEDEWIEVNNPTYKPKDIELIQLKDVYINPFSNRFQANYLFKKMVDYIDDHELYYPCGYFGGGLTYEVNVPLFDVSCKSDWYRWCYLNTKRSKTSYSTMFGSVRTHFVNEQFWDKYELVKWYLRHDGNNNNKKNQIISKYLTSCYDQLFIIERDLEIVYENLLIWIEDLDILNKITKWDSSSFFGMMYKISPAYTLLIHNYEWLQEAYDHYVLRLIDKK